MSRSFGKFPSYRRNGYENREDIRVRNRSLMHKELVNPEHGEVIFISEKKFFSPVRGDRNSVSKKLIRNRYFKEISNILNGYTDRHNAVFWDWNKAFTVAFYDIRYTGTFNGVTYTYPGNTRITRTCHIFRWLLSRKVREAVKHWKGRPAEALKYLTCHGLIEQAIRQQFKEEVAK